MGFGTTLAPLLLLLGFEPLQVVPAVLLAEFATGLLGAALHQRFGNCGLPRSAELCAALASAGRQAPSRSGVASKKVLGTYIGATVLLTGVFIIATRR